MELGTGPIPRVEGRLEPGLVGLDAQVGQQRLVVDPVEGCVFLGVMLGLATRPGRTKKSPCFPGNLSSLNAGPAAAADDVVELRGGVRIRGEPLAGNDADEVGAERGARGRSGALQLLA